MPSAGALQGHAAVLPVMEQDRVIFDPQDSLGSVLGYCSDLYWVRIAKCELDEVAHIRVEFFRLTRPRVSGLVTGDPVCVAGYQVSFK